MSTGLQLYSYTGALQGSAALQLYMAAIAIQLLFCYDTVGQIQTDVSEQL